MWKDVDEGQSRGSYMRLQGLSSTYGSMYGLESRGLRFRVSPFRFSLGSCYALLLTMSSLGFRIWNVGFRLTHPHKASTDSGDRSNYTRLATSTMTCESGHRKAGVRFCGHKKACRPLRFGTRGALNDLSLALPPPNNTSRFLRSL